MLYWRLLSVLLLHCMSSSVFSFVSEPATFDILLGLALPHDIFLFPPPTPRSVKPVQSASLLQSIQFLIQIHVVFFFTCPLIYIFITFFRLRLLLFLFFLLLLLFLFPPFLLLLLLLLPFLFLCSPCRGFLLGLVLRCLLPCHGSAFIGPLWSRTSLVVGRSYSLLLFLLLPPQLFLLSPLRLLLLGSPAFLRLPLQSAPPDRLLGLLSPLRLLLLLLGSPAFLCLLL
mmetsp:Transcript_317/g.734  ORF Transcript_317/g.734 Transcript_317/m.734 type:complete len:228 (+) Transcript_317:408-1091(+)